MAKRLLLLNGVAIVCVILFHSTGFGFTAMFSWAHRYREVTSPNYDGVGTSAYYVLRLIEQFVVFCIPAFLFVSGFFVSVLAGRARTTVSPRAVGARIRALLVPYLLWSVVAFVLLALQGRVLSAPRYLKLLATGATNPNYYYVPLLIQLYLVAPAIVLLARWNWKALLAATAGLQIGVYILQYPIVLGVDAPAAVWLGAMLPKWLFLSHLFWFAVGVVSGFHQQAFRQLVERWRWESLAATVGLFVLGVLEWELLLRWAGVPWREIRVTLIDGVYSGAAILTFLAFADVRIPFSPGLVTLGSRSYGIYLVHGLVLEYFSRAVYHGAPWILGRQLLLQPMLIVLGVAVPLVLMGLLNRSTFRSLYGYIFG